MTVLSGADGAELSEPEFGVGKGLDGSANENGAAGAAGFKGDGDGSGLTEDWTA
jgi:hypothetical protein